MCLIKQRANNPEQKALRKQQILDSTRKRFTSLSYEEVNLNHIAADVGITKAALYRYFRNKETLFLALFVETLNELINTVEQHTPTENDLCEVITQTLVSNPVYCKLSAILHTILERNLTTEEATQFKNTLLTLTAKYAILLSQFSPKFQDADFARETLMQVQQALIGAWHMTHPVGAIKEVIQTPPLDIFNRSFEDTLRSHVRKIVA